jgi:hypothetical protein
MPGATMSAKADQSSRRVEGKNGKRPMSGLGSFSEIGLNNPEVRFAPKS